MAEQQNQNPLKIIMWCTPRSLSTAIGKCFSQIPGSLIWHEPYISAMWYGTDRRFPAPCDKGGWQGDGDDNMSAKAADIKLPDGVGYDGKKCSYRWFKDQLEAEYPDKSLIFVKGMSFGVDTRYDAIPDGYQHTFLIKHPMKVIPSWKKLMVKSSKLDAREIKMNEIPVSAVPAGYFFKESYDLLQYVKEHFEPHPIILDADDLLANPSGILKAYCSQTGIPYSNDLLEWEAGDAVADTWMIPQMLLKVNKIVKFYEGAFKSTQFNKPGKMPLRSDLTEDELICVDSIMPYYEEMYTQRLTC
ncbi:uncharacterized protein [Amphiura filiformis]|uniref:uncharacterized protein n=1 Tax=Amphiura filiformis TaxID=82378 RepID=UPI003B21135B